MRVVKGDGDAVRFENLNPGDPFYPVSDPSTLYLRVTDGKGGWPAANFETGTIREFKPADPVRPAKAEVVVQEVGRVACGFNPR